MKFCYNVDHFMKIFNEMIYPDYFITETEDDDNTEENTEKVEKPEKKYEDKYLEEIRKMSKDFQFNKEEEETIESRKLEHRKQMNDQNTEKLEFLKNKLNRVEKKLERVVEAADGEYCVYSENESEDSNDDNDLIQPKEQVLKLLLEEKRGIVEQMADLFDTEERQNDIIKKAHELAHDFVVNQRLEKIKNCYIMETTPLGNVLMIYDSSRGTFKYFSDNTIPYRYLEPVARKYVKSYDCRPIFVDMEEELKLAEEKWEKERKEKQEKEEQEKKRRDELKNSNKPPESRKSVFAKFKSYNKDQATSKSMAPPPKNSIPNKALTKEQENEKILLKERANRYTYEGKLSNFSFLKKVERKIVDRKYGMTFADFKKMQQK